MIEKDFKAGRAYVGVAVGAIAFLAIGSFLERYPGLEPLKSTLQAKHAHRSSFPGNLMMRLFNQVGLIHAEPNNGVSRLERLATGGRKRGATLGFWGVEHDDRSQPPST